MGRVVRILRVVVCLAVCAPNARADRARPYFQSSRALSMGNAYTPHDYGVESVYYNPAAVARPREVIIKPFDLELIASKDAFDLMRGAKGNLTQLGALGELLAKTPGTTYATGFSFLPQFLVKNFSLGLLARGMTEAFVEDESFNLNSYAFADLGMHMAVGASLWGGVLKIGVAGRFINRAEMNRTYTPSQYLGKTLDFSSQWQEGQGFGGDVGMILTSPTFAFPRIAVAILDVGSTKMREKRTLFASGAAPEGAPPDIPQRINAGLGFMIKHGSGIRTAFNVEMKDWAHALHGNPIDYFHTGAEFNARERFSLRAGYNEGRYWTAGIGMKMLGIGMEGATYGENISHRDGGRVDDRKYVLRLYVEF